MYSTQIERLDLGEHVRLRGFTPEPDTAARAGLLCEISSSYREGISNFILEAWAAGVPHGRNCD
ncbi:MAG: hypothetical protein IPH10_08310 [bacterium]|nr:hypothetical protein [bacterium]